MSFTALEVLQSLEHSRASARFMFTGSNGHGELWIENGEINRVEGCHVDSLRKHLLQSPVEIWVRPLELQSAFDQNGATMNIKDLALEAAIHHDSGKIEMLSSRNHPIKRSEMKAYREAKEKIFPSLVKDTETSSPSLTQTANHSLQKIAEAVDPGFVAKQEREQSLITQSYHSIRITKNKAEKKLIGRANSCDIVIIEHRVSRKHCEISFDGEKIQVIDLGSTNGTYLNNEHISGPTEAQSHYLIKVGSTICMLKVV